MAKTKKDIESFFEDFGPYSQESSQALMAQVHDVLPKADVIGYYSIRDIMDVVVSKASSIRQDIINHPMIRNCADMDEYVNEQVEIGNIDAYDRDNVMKNITPELIRDYIENLNPDDRRRCLCDIIGIGYCDAEEKEKFKQWAKDVHYMRR